MAEIDLTAYYYVVGVLLSLRASIFGAFYLEHIVKRA